MKLRGPSPSGSCAAVNVELARCARVHLCLRQRDHAAVDARKATDTGWRKWFFSWMEANGDPFAQIFRPEPIDDLFGKEVTSLGTVEERCAFVYLRGSKQSRRQVHDRFAAPKPSEVQQDIGAIASAWKVCCGLASNLGTRRPDNGYVLGRMRPRAGYGDETCFSFTGRSGSVDHAPEKSHAKIRNSQIRPLAPSQELWQSTCSD